jgi:hypothetical protein
MTKGHCATCGVKLSPFDKREGGYSWHPVINVNEIRPMYDGRAEQAPQLLILLSIYRNGGPEDPVCDGCIKAALTKIQEHMGELLAPAEVTS